VTTVNININLTLTARDIPYNMDTERRIGAVSFIKTLCIPIAIVAVASLQVGTQLDDAVAHFFSLTVVEQMSLLAIVFAVVLGAVSLSTMLKLEDATPFTFTSTSTKTYPLAELNKATTDKDKFVALYPSLRKELLDCMKNQNEMDDEALDWCEKMMDYNVPGGKLNRGTTVIAVYRALLGTELTTTQIARAAVCGWSIELLQAQFLVADDVMDDSQTRRGQPCWYKVPHVKLIAVNDSFLLGSYVFTLLKEHFGSEPCYFDLVSVMLDVVQKTELGQLLDLTSQTPGTIDLTRFTLDRYKQIVKYKTAFYSFYLPIAMGMILSGYINTPSKNKAEFDLANTICCEMGEYFQVQDDYLDCFGAPEVIGKIGTDIQDNKCSWLVVQALDRATPAQRKVLEQNYGVWNEGKVEKVKKLYSDLNLTQVFQAYEEASYQRIQSQLEQTLLPRQVFEVLLQKIYKRSK
jgi:farnesyl diphosphate synthase